MRNEDKIKLADAVLDIISQSTDKKNIPVYVGSLERKFGINGFKAAEVGTPVFEFNDKHIIYLESLDGKTSVEVPFYKGDLSVRLADAIQQHAPVKE